MEEGISRRVILILGILSLIFLVSAVASCNNNMRLRSQQQKEMASRMESEEKLLKLQQEKAKLENALQNATQALETERASHEATKKLLLEEQLVTKSLKEELAKVTKLKETLEENLKEALVDKSKK